LKHERQHDPDQDFSARDKSGVETVRPRGPRAARRPRAMRE
jgi:hypothetical protein